MQIADLLLHGTCYSALTTSWLAQSELTVQQVEDALKNEEAHRVRAAATAAAVPSPGSQTAAPASSLICAFCGKNRHTVECCFKFADSSKKARRYSNSNRPLTRKNRCSNCKGKANATQDTQTPTESAGAASIHLSSSPCLMPGMQTQGPLLI